MMSNLLEFLMIAIPIFYVIGPFREGYLSYPKLDAFRIMLPPEKYIIGFTAGSAILSTYLLAIHFISRENKIEEEHIFHSLGIGVFFVAVVRWSSYLGGISLPKISQYVVDGLYISPFILWAVGYHWLRRDYNETGVSSKDLFKNSREGNFSKLEEQIELKKKSNLIRYIFISLLSKPKRNIGRLASSTIFIVMAGVISFSVESFVLSHNTGLLVVKSLVVIGFIGYLLSSVTLIGMSKKNLSNLEK